MKKIQFLLFGAVFFLTPGLFAQGKNGEINREGPAEIPPTPANEEMPAFADPDPPPKIKNTPNIVGPILLQAVQNEDTGLYSQWMQFSLNHFNITEFLHLIMTHRTGEGGDSLFHLMAKVKAPSAKVFFAREIKGFNRLFQLKFRSGRILGGEKIIIPPFRNTALGQAVRHDRKSPGYRTEMRVVYEIQNLKTTPVKQLIQDLIGQPEGLETLTHLFAKRYVYGFGGMLDDSFIHEVDNLSGYQDLLKNFKGITNFSRNKAGEIPVETAVNTGNLQAWRALKAHSRTDEKEDARQVGAIAIGTGVTIGLSLLAIPTLLLGVDSPELLQNNLTNLSHFTRMSESTVHTLVAFSPFLAGITAGVASYKCKDVVSRWKIYKNNKQQPAVSL